jgi:RNA polymerase sigma-70 factor (ECF subfamily)
VRADEELLEAWRAGDGGAGEELFDRHFRAVTRFFRNKAPEAMDDLMQQTFVGVLEGRERFRGEGTFRSFLFGVAYNVLREHYRARRRDEERIDFGVTSVHDLAPRPSELLADRRDERVLLEALRRVPLEHQVLLELYFWEPLPAPRIAEILDVPVGTVRTRLRRAKEVLAAEVQRLAPGGGDLESTLTRLDDWARSLKR